MKTSIHILLFSLGLQLTACGGDDGHKNTPTANETSTSSTTTTIIQPLQQEDKTVEKKQDETVIHSSKTLLSPVTEEPPADATMTRAQRDKEARRGVREREQRLERKDKQTEND